MKTDYIRIVLTKEQKKFIKKMANQEFRTMTSIINIALKNKYDDYPL